MASFQSKLYRLIVKYYVGRKYLQAGKSIEAWKELTDQFIRFQRVPKNISFEAVEVNGIPAEWVRAPQVNKERAILYLHGGGFVMGSPTSHRELAGRLSATTQSPLLVLDYRLAPEYPFPAAVDDTLTAYSWLQSQGFSPADIAIGGDSAGGGLAIQSLLALRESRQSLPAAGFAMSPPLDWVHFDGESYQTRADVDPWITEEMCRFTGALYVSDNDPATPLLNPLRMDLTGLPPLCIHVGDQEVLLSDSTRLVEQARAVSVEVQFKVWEGMWHVFQIGASMIPEAQQSLEEIGLFIREKFG